MASTECLGRDPTVWGERAGEFVPERFVVGNGSSTNRVRTASKASYFPFGAGQRSCVGQQAALTIATMALAYVVASDDEHDTRDATPSAGQEEAELPAPA